MKPWNAVRAWVVCAVAGVLVACAQAPKPLYGWDAYQPSVYATLKDEDIAKQVLSLESNVETARAGDVALPPGFRAHLGMLYLKMGQGDKAAAQWLAEKLAFPEGETFMDFLLRNAGGADVALPQPAAWLVTADPGKKEQPR